MASKDVFSISKYLLCSLREYRVYAHVYIELFYTSTVIMTV